MEDEGLMTTILIMAEEDACQQLSRRLPQSQAYRYLFLPNARQALAMLRQQNLPVVIVPMLEEDPELVSVIRQIHEFAPATSVMVTFPGLPSAPLKKRLNGAVYDYLSREASGAELEVSLRHAIHMHRVVELNNLYGQRLVNLELGMHRATEIRRGLRHVVRKDPILVLPGLKMGSRLLPLDGIGGDFLGSFQLADGKIGVYLGDAAGHDVSSTMIRDFIEEEIDLLYGHETWEILGAPEKLLAYLSRKLYPVSRVYATMVYLVIDQRNQQVYFSSAGHTPFICRKTVPDANGDMVNLYFSKSVMLGVERDPTYKREQICLHNYSHITLYSDGLVNSRFEVRQDHAKGFDTEDLKYLHTFAPDDPQEFADLLVGHSRKLHPQQDDIAILTIRTGAAYHEQAWPEFARHREGHHLDLGDLLSQLTHNVGAEIGFQAEDGSGIIVVHGKADVAVADALYVRARRHFRTDTLKWLILDCLDVTAMESSFLGFMQDLSGQCDKHGIRLTISIVDGLLMHSIREMGLAMVVDKCTHSRFPWDPAKLRTVRKMGRGISRTLNRNVLRAHEELAQLCEENRIKFGPLIDMLRKELENAEQAETEEDPLDLEPNENVLFGDRKL